MITYSCKQENKKMKKGDFMMSKTNNGKNVTKKLTLIERVAKYIEENAIYFEGLDANWNGRFYGRY